MTENKRYTKEYFDEYNKEYDFIEEDILTIFDNVSNKKYFMELADDDEMNNTIDELINRLNEQEELIKRLKTIREEQTETILKQKRKMQELEERNKRQYNRLKEITDLMSKRDWKTLENIADEWEKQEKLLNQEWNNCEDL